jgi:hypothetical protein
MVFSESNLLALTVAVAGIAGFKYLYDKHEKKHQSGGRKTRKTRK